MSEQQARWSLTVREGADRQPFYEVMWWSQVRAAAVVAEVEARLAAEAQERAARVALLLKFREVAHKWLDEMRREAEPATVRDYESLLREPGALNKRGSGTAEGRIIAAFGDRVMESVTPREVLDFLRTLDDAGFTARNVNKYRQTISVVFSYACRADTHELEFNPVTSVRKRREPAPAALEVLFYAGLRLGEARSLRWRGVDL